MYVRSSQLPPALTASHVIMYAHIAAPCLVNYICCNCTVSITVYRQVVWTMWTMWPSCPTGVAVLPHGMKLADIKNFLPYHPPHLGLIRYGIYSVASGYRKIRLRSLRFFRRRNFVKLKPGFYCAVISIYQHLYSTFLAVTGALISRHSGAEMTQRVRYMCPELLLTKYQPPTMYIVH